MPPAAVQSTPPTDADHGAATWQVAARVVFPDAHDADVLPLYVDYGARAPRIDDAYDRQVRGWHEYKGVEASGPSASEHRIADVLSRTSISLPALERVSFATYFNAFPASYWRRWTDVDTVRLVADIVGEATLVVYRSTARGTPVPVHTVDIAASDADSPASRVEVELDLVPFVDGGWYWFDVVAGPAGSSLASAVWEVYAAPVRPARLSIGVTTVNKVDFVDRLVGAIAAAEELRAHLDTVWIVDQGSVPVTSGAHWQAHAAALGEQVRVVPQANLGGSGGFSRGMFETLTAGRSTFHLVLDDDVRIEPEGILRAVRFAAMTRTPTIVGAHMFDLHAPTTLHSFGEVVDPVKWTFGPVLGVHEEWDLAASSLRETPWLHRRTDVSYNGWWMCLIPTEVLATVGLSLPIFIKWDDAEHCLRAGAAGYPTVSFPGAAVWHVSWNDKDDLWEWQAYYHQRNLLLTALLHSREPHGGQAPMLSFAWLIRHGISMRYYANALRLRALRDLLSGPDHLHRTLASTLPQLRAAAADFPDAQPRPNQADFPAPSRALGGGLPRLPARTSLPRWGVAAGLRQVRPVPSSAAETPQIAVPARYAQWWFLAMFDSAIVSKRDGTGAAWYRRDRAMFRSQLTEGLRLHLRLYREWDTLARTYRDALADITSPQSWARTFFVGVE